jgi:hypothetical protein
MLRVCYESFGKIWVNFLVLYFYKRSDGGGVSEAVEKRNEQLICSYDNISYCQSNNTFGVYNFPYAL